MKYQKVYALVSVDERLPEYSELLFVYCTHTDLEGNSMRMFPQMSHFNKNNQQWHVNSKTLEVTHWLEEKQNRYVLGEDELKKFATDFFYWWYNQKGTNTQQGFDEFLKSKSD